MLSAWLGALGAQRVKPPSQLVSIRPSPSPSPDPVRGQQEEGRRWLSKAGRCLQGLRWAPGRPACPSQVGWCGCAAFGGCGTVTAPARTPVCGALCVCMSSLCERSPPTVAGTWGKGEGRGAGGELGWPAGGPGFSLGTEVWGGEDGGLGAQVCGQVCGRCQGSGLLRGPQHLFLSP